MAIIVALGLSNVYCSEVIVRVTNSKKNHVKVTFVVIPRYNISSCLNKLVFSLLCVFHQWPLVIGAYSNALQSLKLYFPVAFRQRLGYISCNESHDVLHTSFTIFLMVEYPIINRNAMDCWLSSEAKYSS